MTYQEDIKSLGFVAATIKWFKSTYPSGEDVKIMFSEFIKATESLDLSSLTAEEILSLSHISQSFLSGEIKSHYKKELGAIKSFIENQAFADPRAKKVSYHLKGDQYEMFYQDSLNSFCQIPRKNVSTICREYIGLPKATPLLLSLTLQEAETIVKAYLNLQIKLALGKISP